MDKLYILLSKNKKVSGYLCHINETAKKVKEIHNYNIIANAILLRAIASTVLVSGNLKNKNDELIFKWQCTGPIKSIVVEVDYEGRTMAYVGNPNLEYIEGSIVNGSIKAEEYIGFGELVVMRRAYDGRAPYVSVTVLESGEIAHDVSVFLNQSLQVECAMKLALSLNKNNEVEVCGGILLMAFPDATDEEINEIYKKFNSFGSLTDLFKQTDPDNFISLLDKFDMELIATRNIRYECNCNKNKILNFLVGLNQNEFTNYIMEDGKISATCEFCNREYIFTPLEIEEEKKKLEEKEKSSS